MALKCINNSLVLILSLLFISSCTLHKRIDKNGYFVEFKHKSAANNNSFETANMDLNESNVYVEAENKSLSTNNFEGNITAEASSNKSGDLNIDNENSEVNLEGSEIQIIAPLDKQLTLREINKMSKSTIKSEIKKEVSKIKKFKALTPRRRMSIILKLAIILTGVSLVLLIISFWLWIFNAGNIYYDAYTGTYLQSSYNSAFLVAGLVTLGAGLFLFILSFLAS